MGIETVRQFFAEHAPDVNIEVLETSTATVQLAADALDVAPGQIAKTLAFKVGEKPLLIVASGNARIDNRKIRDTFGGKAKMLDAETVMELTSHPVGGVCPFGLATNLPVYCDESLHAYDEVLPAAGSSNSAVRLSPKRLAELVNAEWVDVCRLPESDYLLSSQANAKHLETSIEQYHSGQTKQCPLMDEQQFKNR